MPYNFQYTPTSGPLSGQSFETQTRQAINEIGGLSEFAIASGQAAENVAENAQAAAQNAVAQAENAASAAQNAEAMAQEAKAAATAAQGGVDAAAAVANEALDEAITAKSLAAQAESKASGAETLATSADAKASVAERAAGEAQGTAATALEVSRAALGHYVFTDTGVDADAALRPQKLFVAEHADNRNFPVQPPLYFTVIANNLGDSVTQYSWAAATPQTVYVRSAVIEEVENTQTGEVTEVATWNEYSNTAAYHHKYDLCEFYYFRHPVLKPGFRLAQGELIANAATLYPEAWAYLQTADGQLLCKTEAEWQAMTTATWATLADGSTVGWGGIGGASYYVQDLNAGTLRLPDLRGMYAEAAGFDALGVGGVHGDGMRNIVGDILNVPCVAPDNAFYVSPGTAAYQPGTQYQGHRLLFDTSRVVPVANKNQPRAWGALACVYLGVPR